MIFNYHILMLKIHVEDWRVDLWQGLWLEDYKRKKTSEDSSSIE